MTTVAVFGLGYVGAVTTAALADAGHSVIGVDTNDTKVSMIEAGQSPVVEPGLEDLLSRGVAGGRIKATTDAEWAASSAEVILICVGTPSLRNGGLDLRQIEGVSRQIGLGLRGSAHAYPVVVARSTMLPGSTHERVLAPIEEGSGLIAGEAFGVGYNPEFLREGTSLHDYYAPPFTLIGADDARTADVVGTLYANVEAEVVHAPVRVAEMVKYTSNAYHALKVTFANEIGSICSAMGVDSRAVMEIFAMDTKLNISGAYLKPGFAFGGSCLPKDLRALTYHAKTRDVPVPVLDSILPSNDSQIERAVDMIMEKGKRRVGLLGLSFKADTDDLRESPLVAVVERLIGKGYDLRIFDRSVSLANLQGANKAFIEKEIPHISSLLVDSIEELVAFAQVVVVGNGDAEFRRAVGLLGPEQRLVDLVGLDDALPERPPEYRGIAW